MEINDIRRSTFYIFIFFLTISEINNKARQNISCKTITELAVLSWTCNLWENLHTEEKNFMLMKKLKANHCMSWGLLQLHRHHIWRMDLTVAPKHFFRISCSGSDAYTRVSKNCFDRRYPIAYAFWITPDIQNKRHVTYFSNQLLTRIMAFMGH